jgi:hypothetical protein
MGHFLGDFIHFDSQIFRTAIPLLFKPGFLTNEFLSGKHAKYLNPLKMYVFLSFLFFFLSFSTDKSEPVDEVHVKGVSPVDSVMQKLDSVDDDRHYQLSFDTLNYQTLGAYDSMQAAKAPGDRDGFVKRTFIRKVMSTKSRVENEGGVNVVNEIIDAFKHNFPKLAFILLPVFALLLKLFYYRKKMYYIEHLIFSIHYYNFFFLCGSIVLLLSWMISSMEGALDTLFVLALPVYFFAALRNVYANSRWKTFFKTLAFIFLFSILVGLAFLGNVFISFMMIS